MDNGGGPRPNELMPSAPPRPPSARAAGPLPLKRDPQNRGGSPLRYDKIGDDAYAVVRSGFATTVLRDPLR